MATSLTMQRACWNSIRQMCRLEPKPSFHLSARSFSTHHQQCPLPFSLSPSVSHVPMKRICVHTLSGANNASSSHFAYICQRSFSTKWFSTTSKLFNMKEKREEDLQSTVNSQTLKDADDRVNDGQKDLGIMDEEEESIIPKTDEKGQPLSNWKRMKVMMKAYGYVIIPVHWVIAPFWFGAFYYTIKMGVDIGPFLSAIGVSEHHIETLRNSKASTALMAYALYKIFTPLRYTVTLGATEITIRRLRKMGYMRPHPPKEKLYRDSFKETVGEMRDKIKDIRDSKPS